jgi:hypothetical protein
LDKYKVTLKGEFAIGKNATPTNTGMACQEKILFICSGPHLVWFGTVHTQLGAISAMLFAVNRRITTGLTFPAWKSVTFFARLKTLSHLQPPHSTFQIIIIKSKHNTCF